MSYYYFNLALKKNILKPLKIIFSPEKLMLTKNNLQLLNDSLFTPLMARISD